MLPFRKNSGKEGGPGLCARAPLRSVLDELTAAVDADMIDAVIVKDLTIYGSIAQSESENMSPNIMWGKNQSAKAGKVNFHYKTSRKARTPRT